MAMDDVRAPSQLFHGFQHSAGVKYRTLVIICEEFVVFVVEGEFPVKVVLVVNEIDLHACLLDGGGPACSEQLPSPDNTKGLGER